MDAVAINIDGGDLTITRQGAPHLRNPGATALGQRHAPSSACSLVSQKRPLVSLGYDYTKRGGALSCNVLNE